MNSSAGKPPRLAYEALKGWQVPPIEQTYTVRDTLLYALGVGIGHDPTSPAQLAYVYEANLRVLPTMAPAGAVPGGGAARLLDSIRSQFAGEKSAASSVVFHSMQHIKPRLCRPGVVANPRDATGHRCGLRLARTTNPSVLLSAA